MYISMPRDFFVPVMYDYKENLNLIDEDSQGMCIERVKRMLMLNIKRNYSIKMPLM